MLLKTNIKWYVKMFCAMLIVSFSFMFALGVSAQKATTDVIDVKVGLKQPRSSQAMTWFKSLPDEILGTIKVNAQLATLDVLGQIRDIAFAALIGLIETLVNSLASFISGILSEISKAAGVYRTVQTQINNIKNAMLISINDALERAASSEVIATKALGSSANPQRVKDFSNAVARLRFAKVEQEIAVPNGGSSPVSTRQDIAAAEQQVATIAQQSCAGNGANGFFLDGIFSGYSSCRVTEEITAVALQNDLPAAQKAFENLTSIAPADCKTPFVDFNNEDFGAKLESGGTDLTRGSGNNLFGNTTTFGDSARLAASNYKLTALTPDQCDAIQSSTDTALQGLKIDTPSVDNPLNYTIILQAVQAAIRAIVEALINSVFDLINDVLNKAISNLPRIFNRGPLRELVGSVSDAVRADLRNLEQRVIDEVT
jgi:hypothetical protein